MILNLIRKEFTDKSTIGDLYIDGTFFCYTLEDIVRDLKDLNNDGDFDDVGEGKVYGKTAIPYGEYNVVLSMSNRFKKVLPEVLNVPGYSGVRIHAGNTDKDTHGCPLVGMTKSKDFIGMSRIAMNKLMQRLSGNKKIKLIIEKESLPPGACV